MPGQNSMGLECKTVLGMAIFSPWIWCLGHETVIDVNRPGFMTGIDCVLCKTLMPSIQWSIKMDYGLIILG